MNISSKNFGGNIAQNQIEKVRVSSGGRVKPSATNSQDKAIKQFCMIKIKQREKQANYGSQSRNQAFKIPNASSTGKSYNKSNTREYSPQNLSKSPTQNIKKSRNNRIGGSQTHIANKRRQSKKYSIEENTFKTIKNTDKSK